MIKGDRKMKYELLDYKEKRMFDGVLHDIYRIRALIDIPSIGVEVGDIGGWISENSLLSHEGNCWIGAHSYVLGSNISGDVFIRESEILDSTISGKVGHDNRITGTKVLKCSIQHTHFEFKESMISNVKTRNSALFTLESVVRKLELYDSNVTILGSSVESRFEPLVFMMEGEDKVVITDSELKIETENPDCARVHSYLSVKGVKTETPLRQLTVFESLVLENLILEDMSIFTGKFRYGNIRNSSSLIGTGNEQLKLKSATIELRNGNLVGRFNLTGKIVMEDVKINDMASIESHDEKTYLCLAHVEMYDFSKIFKSINEYAPVENKVFRMDDEYNIDKDYYVF